MAQGYVTGTAHIFVGILTNLGVIIPPPEPLEQHVLRTGGLYPDQSSLTTVTPPTGGTTPGGNAYLTSPGLQGGNAFPGSPGLQGGNAFPGTPTPGSPPSGDLLPLQGGGNIVNQQGGPVGKLFSQPTPTTVWARLPYYLGTARLSAVIEIERGWHPWHDDELGLSFAEDSLEEGEEAVVVVDINRWNEPVYLVLSKITAQAGGAGRGAWLAGDTGTSVMFEGFTYPLWLQFPYAAKPAMAAGRGGPMPAGYHFWNAVLYGPDRLEPLNHTPSERRLIWRCRRYLDAVSGISVLYDHDMTGVGSAN